MLSPTVVKLGGSHAFSDHLTPWLDAIAQCAGQVVVVPGGGPFADAVRDAQPLMRFDDRAAHRMALLAMEQYGCALAALNAALVPADSLETIANTLDARRVPVWMPTRMAIEAPDIAASWDITSDSLAAWLCGKLGAARLVLVKHGARGQGGSSVSDLTARGVVDPAFGNFLAKADCPAFLLGPDEASRLAQIVGDEPAAAFRIHP
jgi:5-(aminomethyl)-3-furanmethanol phosphate kinase